MASKSTQPLLLKFQHWPKADQQAWEAARQMGDVLDPGAPASGWSEASVIWMRNGYAHWQGWTKRTGLYDPDAGPAEAVTRANVARYIEDTSKINASSTVADRIQKLYHVAKALDAERDWQWVHAIWKGLDRRAQPARDKRKRMVEAKELWGLGIELMEEGERVSAKSPLQAALLYRDGLIIGVLAARGLRRKNLSQIEIGKHLVKRGDIYHLDFAAPEMKGRKPAHKKLPHELTSRIDRYLDQHRVVLFPRNRGSMRPSAKHDPASCRALWVSQCGTAMNHRTIYGRVLASTLAKFGHSVNLHLARDVIATSVAIHDPKHVRSTASMLDHSDFGTTEDTYIMAQSLKASRRYQNRILELRRQAARVGQPTTASSGGRDGRLDAA